MSMIKKVLSFVICAAVIMSSSGSVLAAGSDGVLEVSKLEMIIRNVALKPGRSRNIGVTISPGKADDKSVVWTSGDNSIATVRATSVNGRAVVTAVGEGQVKITAASRNGKTAVCTVTVSNDEIEVRRIEMTTPTATIRLNQMKALSVEITPRNADDKTIAWESGNYSVVTVEDDGIITGISPGTTEITATSANGKTAVCTVTVTSETLTETERKTPDLIFIEEATTLVGRSMSMTKGQTKDLSEYIQYKERYMDSRGEWHTEWRLVGKVTWASSFPEVVSINDKGVAVAHRTGTSRITATGRDETGRKCVQTIVMGVSAK